MGDGVDHGVQRRRRGADRAQVIDVAPLAREETRVLAAADSLTDHRPRMASRIQAMNTPWKGSRAHSETAPPGIAGKSSALIAMCRLAGNTPIIVAISHQPASRRRAG